MKRQFFPALFEELNAASIPYAVLRNYEQLPAIPEGTDIDLLILPRDLKAYKEILDGLGGKVLFSKRTQSAHSVLLFEQGRAIWLDAYTSIATKGISWMDGELLLRERKWNEQGFYVLDPAREAEILFLKEALAGRPIKDKYKQKIQEHASFETFSFNREVLDLIQKGSWDEARRKGPLWLLGMAKPQHIPSIASFLFFAAWERLRFRKGILIAFLGPDGAGKTSLCEELEKRLSQFPFRGTRKYHGQPGWFPELGKMAKTGNVSEQRRRNPIFSLIRLLYYGLEFLLASPWLLWKKRRGHALLFDRYFYDFSLQRRLHWLFRLFLFLIPHPDLVFLLKGPAGVLHQRKPELTEKEIEEQFFTLEGLSFAHPIVLDATQDLNALADFAEEQIANLLSKK